MTDSTQKVSKSGAGDSANITKSNPWPKRAGIACCLGVFLLIAAYFVVGSAFFVRSVVLPMVESSMMAKVEVGDVSFKPLSGIELQDLEFTPADQETMVSAQRATVQYSLGDIIGGTIKLNQLHLQNPKVTIIEREDGSSNLTDWLNSLPPSPDAPLPKMDLNDLDVADGTIIYQRTGANQETSQLEVVMKKAHVTRLGQDLSSTINLESLIRLANRNTSTNEDEELLSTQIVLNGDLDLNADLFPSKSSLTGSINVQSSSPDYEDLKGVGGVLTLSLQPNSIEDASIRFSKNGQAAGSVELSGPMNFTTLEGDLQMALTGLNRQFLNLAGAIAGLDFGDTVVDGTLNCSLTKGGSHIAISSVTSVKDFSVEMEGMALPKMNTEVKLVTHYDADQELLIIREWNLKASDNQRAWLEGSIDKPVTLSWGLNRGNFQDSKFLLSLKQMDLAPWNSLLGGLVQQGELNGELDVSFLQQGKRIQANARGELSKASLTVNDRILADNHMKVEAVITMQDFNRMVLDRMNLEWLDASEEAVATLSGSGGYHLEKPDMQLQIDANGNLPLMATLLPLDGLVVEKGSGTLTARVQQRDNGWAGNLQTALSGYTGGFGGLQFNQYSVEMSGDGSLQGEKFRLGNTRVAFKEGYELGGSIGLSGDLDLSSMKGQFEIQSEGINRHAFQPVLGLQANEGPFKEVGLELNGALDVDLAAESSFQGKVDVTNLQYEDAETKEIRKLMSELGWDLAWTAEQLDIRESTLKLSPTARAGNTLKLSGQLPIQPSLASKGLVKVSSASLDLTPYMDLLMAHGETVPDVPGNAPQPNSAEQKPAPQTAEPAPLDVPLGELDAQVDIGKLFMRDLSVQAFKGRLLWQTNTLHLEPVSMQVNNAPVEAKLHMDFTKPDWGYGVNFDVQKLPVQAITDTLDPANKGKISGLLTAKGDWSGSGLMEPALQRNMNGSTTIQYSDANIELVSPTIRLLMTPITALLRLPELMKAPITGVEANVAVQNQVLSLKDTKVLSDAFQVHTGGEIPLDNVLTNSVLNLPVEFHLERSIARKSNLIPSSAPKDTPYVKLPDFVSLQGTLGKPVTKTDKLVLSGLLMKSAAGLPLNVGEGAVNALKGVGNFLVGDSGKKADEETGSDASGGDAKAEPAGGVLQQVNPFKLFNQITGGGNKKQQEESAKEDQ